MTVTTLTDINNSDIDKDQTFDTYKQSLVNSFNDVFQQSSITKNALGKRKSSIHYKAELDRKAILENVTKNPMPGRVVEPKEKRSKKDSTSNGNENLRSEIVVNEYPQKPKKQTSLSSFFKTKQAEVYNQPVFAK